MNKQVIVNNGVFVGQVDKESIELMLFLFILSQDRVISGEAISTEKMPPLDWLWQTCGALFDR